MVIVVGAKLYDT